MLWPQFHSWVGEICWRRDKLPTPVFLGFPGGSTGKESARNAQDPISVPGLERSAGEGISCPLQYSWAFLCGLAGKESTCSMGDLGLIPGLGRSPGERKDYPFQYSGLENSMDCIGHAVTKSQTLLSDLHFQENVSWKLLLSIHEQRWNLIFHIMCRLEEIIFASERREIHRDHGK